MLPRQIQMGAAVPTQQRKVSAFDRAPLRLADTPQIRKTPADAAKASAKGAPRSALGEYQRAKAPRSALGEYQRAKDPGFEYQPVTDNERGDGSTARETEQVQIDPNAVDYNRRRLAGRMRPGFEDQAGTEGFAVLVGQFQEWTVLEGEAEGVPALDVDQMFGPNTDAVAAALRDEYVSAGSPPDVETGRMIWGRQWDALVNFGEPPASNPAPGGGGGGGGGNVDPGNPPADPAPVVTASGGGGGMGGLIVGGLALVIGGVLLFGGKKRKRGRR